MLFIHWNRVDLLLFVFVSFCFLAFGEGCAEADVLDPKPSDLLFLKAMKSWLIHSHMLDQMGLRGTMEICWGHSLLLCWFLHMGLSFTLSRYTWLLELGDYVLFWNVSGAFGGKNSQTGQEIEDTVQLNHLTSSQTNLLQKNGPRKHQYLDAVGNVSIFSCLLFWRGFLQGF